MGSDFIWTELDFPAPSATRQVGIVQQLWRYPVSSLGGERVSHLGIAQGGVGGDREFVLVDTATGEVAAPETTPRWRRCVFLAARSVQSHQVLVSSLAWELEVGDAALDQALSEFMGFHCGIRPVGRSDDHDSRPVHYARRYEVSPLHVLTTSNLANLQAAVPNSFIDVRRFRPNVVIDSVELEDRWVGDELEAGSYSGTVIEATKRCGMTMLAQPGVDEDPDVLRAVVRGHGRRFGVYAGVTRKGTISVGDTAYVTTPEPSN
jgi:uncharacterized protein YcbX